MNLLRKWCSFFYFSFTNKSLLSYAPHPVNPLVRIYGTLIAPSPYSMLRKKEFNTLPESCEFSTTTEEKL